MAQPPRPHPALDLLARRERLVAGIMSGTSLDGVDVALARFSGSGASLQMEVLGLTAVPFSEPVRAALRAQAEPETSSVRGLSQLHALLGTLYAEAVRQALREAGLMPTDLDLVGCHGQTVQHVPVGEPYAGAEGVRSTLQIGDAAGLAARLGAPVVADFRSADLALGGEAAPLVPYFDWAVFAHPEESRLMLNLGGVANLTVLPAGGPLESVRAFDTGPANLVLDALAGRLLGRPYDEDGATAAQGTPDEKLLAALLADAYFEQPPPKSTGRERFGSAYVDAFVARGPSEPAALLATATALTARSIQAAYAQFVAGSTPVDLVIASGGGVHNAELMRQLGAAFAPVPVRTTTQYGLDADAKEALCFALLAHEWANGVPTALPSVTGASRAALAGALYLP